MVPLAFMHPQSPPFRLFQNPNSLRFTHAELRHPSLGDSPSRLMTAFTSPPAHLAPPESHSRSLHAPFQIDNSHLSLLRQKTALLLLRAPARSTHPHHSPAHNCMPRAKMDPSSNCACYPPPTTREFSADVHQTISRPLPTRAPPRTRDRTPKPSRPPVLPPTPSKHHLFHPPTTSGTIHPPCE